MSTPGSATPKCPCFKWTPTLNDETPTPKSDILTPQTPGVAFGPYSTADGAITVPQYSTPGFTPYFMRNFLNIGPLTPKTPRTPKTPKTPKTPETPETPSDSKLYTDYYYWYWLLDPLFCTYGEDGQRENALLDSIRLDAMNIACVILDKKLKSYEDRAQSEPVIAINIEFIEEVFKKLETEQTKYIIDQIKNSCQYRAATGTILPSDIFDDCDPQMNVDVNDGSPGVSPVGTPGGGGSTRRRRPIKPSKKRSTVRRRRGRRSSKRKARTTRRRK